MSQPQTYVRASIIDRFIDEEPKQATEACPLRVQTMAQLKASLRRDLEWLLNTRAVQAGNINWADRTVVDYGVPDFGNFFTHNPEDGQHIAEILENTIAAYEPRLQQVKVKLQNTPNPRERQMMLEAVLKVGEIEEAFAFPFVLSDQGNQVKGLD